MEHLIFEKIGSNIGLLKVNRPQILNAINKETLQEMLHFLQKKDTPHYQALILSGVGEKSFIAGADIKELKEMTPTDMLQFCELGQQVSLALETAPYLTIAAVNGYALGGGFEMALACDFIYAAKNAKFGFPEVSLGLIPSFGGTQRFARLVGTRLAKEYIMSGKTLTSSEAYAWGIVNHISDNDHLIKDCCSIAAEIVRHSSWATLQAKRAIDVGYRLSMTESLELERNMCAVCFSTEERVQRISAFLEKHNKG